MHLSIDQLKAVVRIGSALEQLDAEMDYSSPTLMISGQIPLVDPDDPDCILCYLHRGDGWWELPVTRDQDSP